MIDSVVARVRVNVANLLVMAAPCFAILASSYADTTIYEYDVHGRLTVITSPSASAASITTYTYDDAGNRDAVVVATVDTTPPNPPTALAATAQAFDHIRVSWTPSLDVGGGPVSYYRVYRGGQLLASPNGPPFDDWPLAASTSYSYTVSAVDEADNESTHAGPATATTPPGPDLTPPSAPANLQGTAASGTTVNLTWSPSQDNPGGSGVAGYEIFRDGGGTPIATSATTSYSDTTASIATTHLYKVRAYDAADNRSAFSTQISVTTPDTVAPSASGNPNFSSITPYAATATWTAATDNVGVTGYRYSLNGGSSWTYVGNVLSTNLTGLARSTAYTMLVQAGDAAGNWGPSGSGSFTTASHYTDNMAFVGGYASDGSSYVQTGYSSSGLGSLTPNTTSDGKTIVNFTSYQQFSYNPWTGEYQVISMSVTLVVTGFNGNPGREWLHSIGSYSGSTAAFGCSSSTQCWWSWPVYASLTGSYPLTIIHQ